MPAPPPASRRPTSAPSSPAWTRFTEAGGRPPPARAARRRSGGFQVAGGNFAGPTIALDIEADLLSFVEPADAGALDRGDVDEHVLRAVFRLNKTISFLGIEPLDGAERHGSFL